jgi:hypothetical protein
MACPTGCARAHAGEAFGLCLISVVPRRAPGRTKKILIRSLKIPTHWESKNPGRE